MAVRNFDYAEAKNTMSKIQTKAEEVKKYLDKCDNIINENVGVTNRWSGDRATKYKSKWEQTSAEFKSFVEMINQYANKIDESYKTHKAFDEASL